MSDEKQLKIQDALQVIMSLGLPRAQQNDRSALCLLALLNLTPESPWADAENPLIGITPIMDWIRQHYGKDYAPNTRETIRRQTMHQFCDAVFMKSSAGLVFVTAFPNRMTMGRYLSEIAWETEIWVADAPSHMIHFNGERYLGPFEG